MIEILANSTMIISKCGMTTTASRVVARTGTPLNFMYAVRGLDALGGRNLPSIVHVYRLLLYSNISSYMVVIIK